MDRLSEILHRFAIQAEVFFSGKFCGVQAINAELQQGHLHLLKSGSLKIRCQNQADIVLDQPAVIFFSRLSPHELIALSDEVDLVCANITYHDQSANPLIQALPDLLYFPLAEDALLNQTAEWIFAEAFNQRCGKQPMIERLCDVFMIQILRYLIDSESLQQGLLAGLANQQLARLLTQLHKQPEKNWSLEEMAATAGMSRSKFADLFKQTLGQTPGDYLSDWRINMAKNLLQEGKPVNFVANMVGYENSSVLARVFRKKTGQSPREWLQAQA